MRVGVTATAVAVVVAATACATAGAKAPSARSVVLSLRHAGMPVAAYRTYTAATDPNHRLGRPGQYTSKASWHDRRVPAVKGFDVDGGGSVEVFRTTSQAKARMRYIERFSSLFPEYDYVRGAVLLRVSSTLTPRQARGYQRAFAKAVR